MVNRGQSIVIGIIHILVTPLDTTSVENNTATLLYDGGIYREGNSIIVTTEEK